MEEASGRKSDPSSLLLGSDGLPMTDPSPPAATPDPPSGADPAAVARLLDEALARLAARDPRKARLVELRYFADLTTPQAAEVLGISVATAERDWNFARAWLRLEIRGGAGHSGEKSPVA